MSTTKTSIETPSPIRLKVMKSKCYFLGNDTCPCEFIGKGIIICQCLPFMTDEEKETLPKVEGK